MGSQFKPCLESEWCPQTVGGIALLSLQTSSEGPPPCKHSCWPTLRWQAAIDLLAAMRARGVRQNAIVCTSAIGTCGKGGRWREALDVLASMATESVSMDTKGSLESRRVPSNI